MFFKLVKYLLALEACTIIFLSSAKEHDHQEVLVSHPQAVLAQETPIPKPAPILRVTIPFSIFDTLKALEHASPLAKCIVKHEVGGGTAKFPPWYPYAIGAAGELGVVQLHPRGKLPEFYKLGFTNPFDPYQAVVYLEEALKRGQRYHWSPVVTGLCS